jgi:hypothetical protein
MNHIAELRRRRVLTIDEMASLLVVQPDTLLRCEYGDFDHIPEIQAEFQRRLEALGMLDPETVLPAA